MILFTRKGEVIGSYNLGLDLEEFLFSTRFREAPIVRDFRNQVEQYVWNFGKYDIDINFDYGSDGVKDYVTIYITINGERVLGISS